MAFTNLLMLLGLAAVAIPVILHVARRERPIRTQLPTVEFVRRAISRTRRRRRLQDWLLLVVRILLIIFACLFFSRPVWHANPFARSDLARAAVVLVIDDAWYQSAREGNATRLTAVRREALAVLDRLSPGSRAAVFTRSRDAGELTLDLDFVRRQLSTLEPSTTVGDLRGAVARARQLLVDEQGELPGLIVVVTDANEATLRPAAGTIATGDVKLALLPLPPRPPDAWLGPLQMPPQLLPVPNRPYPLSIEVGGEAIPPDARIRLASAGRTIVELPVPPGNGPRTVTFDYVPTSAGTQQLHASLMAGDPIEIDNHSYATINVQAPARIAIVGPGGSAVASRDLLALAAAPPGWLGRQRYAVRVADPDQLDALTADLFVICGGRLPPAAIFETLIATERPIVVWPDSTVPADALNSRLQPILRQPIRQATRDQPVLMPPAIANELGPRQPLQLRSWYTIAAPSSSTPQRSQAIVTGVTPGGGRLLFCGLPFDGDASDLLRLRDFAPFVHRILAAATADASPTTDVTVGNPARLPSPSGNKLSVRLPSGDRLPLAPPIADQVTVANTRQPGFYHVEVDGQSVATFAADLARPRNLRNHLDNARLRQLLPENGQLITGDAALSIPGKAGRRPLELASALILLFAVLLPVEGILTAAQSSHKARRAAS